MKISYGLPSIPRLEQILANLETSWTAAMYAALDATVEPVLDDIRDATKSARVRSSYYTKHYGTHPTIGITVGNSWWPYWLFQEYNTRLEGYWPPHGPGSRIAYWSSMHNVSPHLVAWKIHLRGTAGNFIFSSHWNAALPWMKSKLELAQKAFIRAVVP